MDIDTGVVVIRTNLKIAALADTALNTDSKCSFTVV
jgi:hypothetical protein